MTAQIGQYYVTYAYGSLPTGNLTVLKLDPAVTRIRWREKIEIYGAMRWVWITWTMNHTRVELEADYFRGPSAYEPSWFESFFAPLREAQRLSRI